MYQQLIHCIHWIIKRRQPIEEAAPTHHYISTERVTSCLFYFYNLVLYCSLRIRTLRGAFNVCMLHATCYILFIPSFNTNAEGKRKRPTLIRKKHFLKNPLPSCSVPVVEMLVVSNPSFPRLFTGSFWRNRVVKVIVPITKRSLESLSALVLQIMAMFNNNTNNNNNSLWY